MVDQREAIAAVINAIRSAGLPLAAWTVEHGKLHLFLSGGTDVALPLAQLSSRAPSSLVAELVRQLPRQMVSVTVRSPEDIVELTPGQAARLRFVRWLVSTGRLAGDTATDVPAAAVEARLGTA